MGRTYFEQKHKTMNHNEPSFSSQTKAEINLIPRCVNPPTPLLTANPNPAPSYSCNLRDYKEMKKD